MLTEAHWSPDLKSVLADADLVTPDGMPLVWMMRLTGVPNQDRVAGMDILLGLCQTAPQQNISLFFLGSQPAILERIEQRLMQDFPNLQIAGMEPLPFRPMTQAEDDAIVRKINESGAGVVLVSLGCPKQEHWMMQHKNRVQAVMVGLGGVFPVYAGIHKRAPLWVRELGLEWSYRLLQEPRRLWGRYSRTIPPFVWMAFRQLLTQRLFQNPIRE
jgi:N-acetylglucosaminyldiphosphoundecaprenol N-acetyl-beta-D-mannosaminyltransferase